MNVVAADLGVQAPEIVALRRTGDDNGVRTVEDLDLCGVAHPVRRVRGIAGRRLRAPEGEDRVHVARPASPDEDASDVAGKPVVAVHDIDGCVPDRRE